METNAVLIPVNSLPAKLSKASFKPILAALGHSAYKGRKFRLRAQKSYTVNNGDLLWGGGSRTRVWFLRVEADRLTIVDACDALPSALDGAATFDAEIPPNVLIVEHSFFCGEDAGYTLIAAPRTAALPPAIASLAASTALPALPAHS